MADKITGRFDCGCKLHGDGLNMTPCPGHYSKFIAKMVKDNKGEADDG